MALCADCKSHIRSSMVIDVAPKLPRHPGFRGKFTNPSYSFSRSPPRSDHVNASKVSISVVSHSINVCRLRFDTAVSTPGSNNSVSTIWMVSGWLCELGMFQVSCFAVQRFADVYTLDLDVYRRDLDVAASTHGSNDPIQMFQVVPRWLRNVAMSQVSRFDFSRCFDLYSFDFESSVLTAPSSGSVQTICRIGGWPRRHW